MKRFEYRGEEWEFPFVAYLEEAKNEKVTLIVQLHGAGERGKNFDHIYRHGIPKLLKEGRTFDAVVLFPQCPGEYIWNNMVDMVIYK